MRRSAGFGLNLPRLTPIPFAFLEHVRSARLIPRLFNGDLL
jgi:hypothetical protein